MLVPPDLFRKVLSHFATGVTVVTARQVSGKPWGFTVNSFTSVSLTPPLVLFCVDHAAESLATMSQAEYFAVNFLAASQEAISRRFASRSPDRFEGVDYREGPRGSPLLAGSLGFIECRKVDSRLYGDHTVIVGEVMDAKATGGDPLLFYRSSYARILPATTPRTGHSAE
jgi:3-hydroxy-9,10-secoandrosta-1,3,5(10)-triene-9,17-dione monooxygenase reductase component